MIEDNDKVFEINLTILHDAWRSANPNVIKVKTKDQENVEQDEEEFDEEAEAKRLAELKKKEGKIGEISKFFQKKPGDRMAHYSEQVKFALIEAQVVEEPKDADDDADKVEEDEDEEEKEIVAWPEDVIVGSFLEKFLIASAESNYNDKIDIILLMKAIPIIATKDNLEQYKKFNFLVLQDAFLAFVNAERVTAFDYYDGLNATRVSNVKEIELAKFKNLQDVEFTMRNKIENKVLKADAILRFFEEKWDEWKEKKK